MRFDIVLAPEAVGDLKRFKAGVRTAVRAALETHLRHEPRKTSRSRIKRLRGASRPQFRLRLGDVRVFYDVSEEGVEILAIVEKSEAEAWLTQFANRE
jgi:mRNA-degrading endonuclease RelE of RelBE toxin-antitoxin system